MGCDCVCITSFVKHHNISFHHKLYLFKLLHLVVGRQPSSLLAVILRVPFVDLLTTMTQPELPLTVHEYEEWGDPSDPATLQLVSFMYMVVAIPSHTKLRSPSALIAVATAHDHACGCDPLFICSIICAFM